MKNIWIAIALAASPVVAAGLDYNEYQRRIGGAEQQLDYTSRLLPHDGLDALVPEIDDELGEPEATDDRDKEGEAVTDSGEGQAGADTKPPEAPSVTEDAASADVAPSAPASAPAPAPRRAPPRAQNTPAAGQGFSGVYISPSLRRSQNYGGSTNSPRVVRPDGRRIEYGIPIGTEIRVRLGSGCSNVMQGWCAVITQDDIQGDRRTLPRGSRLFGRAGAVVGSDRLSLNLSRGITPDRQEFTMRGVISGDDGRPGLVAYVTNDGRALDRAGSSATAAAARGALNMIPTGEIATDAGRAAGDQLLREKQSDDRARDGRPAYVVNADPQYAVVMVEETF